MAVVFALLTALSNAVSEMTQHIASTADPRRSSGWQLVRYLFHNPLWLFGWVALAVVEGRLRRYYRLTPEGTRRLAAEAARLHANATAALRRLSPAGGFVT